jgi:phosphoketolase
MVTRKVARPWADHRRTNRNLHVRGYKEEGTITTAFDMRVQNDIDRFHLVQDIVDQMSHLGNRGAILPGAPRRATVRVTMPSEVIAQNKSLRELASRRGLEPLAPGLGNTMSWC